MHESLAVLRNSGRNVGPSVTAIAGLLAPIVTSIVVGVVFVRAAAMGW